MKHGFPHTYVFEFKEGQEGARYTAVRYSDKGNHRCHHGNDVPVFAIRRRRGGGKKHDLPSLVTLVMQGRGFPRAGYTGFVGPTKGQITLELL